MDNSKSLETSRGNSNRLPSLLKNMIGCGHKTILNYGSGLYGDLHKSELEKHGITLINYDKYIEGINDLSKIDLSKIDAVVCSNVLNVIPDDEEICFEINNILKLNKTTYITIYEGNRSNNTTLNSKGYWQRNETKSYFYDKFLKRYNFDKTSKYFVKEIKEGN